MATLDSLIVELKADISGLQSNLRRATADLQAFDGRASQTADNVENSGRRMGVALGLGLAAAGTAAIAMGRSLFDAGAAMQALEARMLASTGSAGASTESLAFLREESERLGLRFVDTANSFASFSAAALRAGISMQDVRATFIGVSEAAVAFRLSNADIQGVFMALSQIASKGTVSMEELRQQLGERLPIAMEAAARGMGVTQAELFKMVERGDVTARQFLPAFGRAIRENIGDAVVESSQSAQSELNRLGNAFDTLKAKAANGEFMRSVADAAQALAQVLSSPAMQEGLAAVANGLAAIVTVAAKAVAGIGLLINQVRSFFGDAEIRKQALLNGEGLAGANARVAASRAQPAKSQASASPAAMETVRAADVVTAINNTTGAVVEAHRARQQAIADVNNEFRAQEIQWCEEHEAKQYDIILSNAEERQRMLEGFLGQRIRTMQEIGQDEVGTQAQNFRTTIQQAAQHNRTFFQLEKAAALAQAALKARESVVSAYAFGSRLGGPVLGAAFAGVAAAAQAANLAAIASTSFGGSGTGTGSGGGGGGGLSGANDQTDSLGRSVNQSRQVFITLQGDDDSLYSKRTVRKLIEQMNEALGDGTKLTVGIA